MSSTISKRTCHDLPCKQCGLQCFGCMGSRMLPRHWISFPFWGVMIYPCLIFHHGPVQKCFTFIMVMHWQLQARCHLYCLVQLCPSIMGHILKFKLFADDFKHSRLGQTSLLWNSILKCLFHETLLSACNIVFFTCWWSSATPWFITNVHMTISQFITSKTNSFLWHHKLLMNFTCSSQFCLQKPNN